MPPSPSASRRRAAARRPRRGGTADPRPRRAATPHAPPARGGRSGPRGAPGSSPAPISSAASGSSASMASICSTNSGLPSAASTIRSRSAGVTSPSSSSPSIRCSDSSSLERRERDEPRARPWRSPGRPRVEDVGSREAEEQDRRAAREAEDVLEQVEQRGLRPVDVVHRDDERSRHRKRLEEPAERPGGLLGGARLVTRADRAQDQPRCDRPRARRSPGAHRAPARDRVPATSRTTSASGR